MVEVVVKPSMGPQNWSGGGSYSTAACDQLQSANFNTTVDFSMLGFFLWAWVLADVCLLSPL